MKQGDTITTKDGIQLIAVPYVGDCGPYSGCFFFKGSKGCVKRNKVENRNVTCWDKNGNH